MTQGIRTLAMATAVDSENPVIGDIKLENGDFVWLDADDSAATAQCIERRLKMFKGEWFYDQKKGFPWFQSVLGKGRSTTKIKSLIRKAVQETPGVRSCESTDYAFNREARALDIEWEAVFDDGKVYSSADFDIPYIVELA